MLHIQKDKEPQAVVLWKKKFKNNSRNHCWPSYQDICKAETEKKILKDALLKEQGEVCCYCCSRITRKNSHIEHFRPKALQEYQHLSLEYQNLHASCMDEKESGRHCGHKKDNQFDEQKMISPLDPDCEGRFAFDMHGEIRPEDAQDEGAEYTIELLGLNDWRLKKAREAAVWTALYTEGKGLLPKSEEERQEMIQRYSEKQQGKRIPYSDIILYFLKKGQKVGI